MKTKEPRNPGVLPPTIPGPNRLVRNTNQLAYIKNTVMKLVWEHTDAWPFHKPVDAVKLGVPVSCTSKCSIMETLIKFTLEC